MPQILVVEDEQHLALGLQFNLKAEGYEVTVAEDGELALDLLLEKQQRFDLIVLDIMLPGKDGFTVASELRTADCYVPILMLTARSRPEDVLKGFASGTDDYLPKPFDLPILIARVKGLLRRRSWAQNEMARNATPTTSVIENEHTPVSPEQYEFNGRTIDFLRQQLQVKDKTYQLTLMETELLRYLIKNVNAAISRKAILEQVWGLREDTDTRAIDNFIVRLRKYLEDDPAHPKYLLTVRGVGYRFAPGI